MGSGAMLREAALATLAMATRGWNGATFVHARDFVHQASTRPEAPHRLPEVV